MGGAAEEARGGGGGDDEVQHDHSFFICNILVVCRRRRRIRISLKLRICRYLYHLYLQVAGGGDETEDGRHAAA